MSTKVQELNVYTVLANRGKKILLLRRQGSKIWEFPGGGVEWGEMPDKAAIRECIEETSITPKLQGLLCITSSSFKKDGKNKHAVYIVYRAKGEGVPKLKGEHDDFAWVSLWAAKKLGLGYNAKPVIKYLEREGSILVR
ncbi:MAG: NUDIX hydrolase [Candidatus Micrarchaeota archaeon]